MPVSPNSTDILTGNNNRQEGELDSGIDEALSLNMSDDEITSVIGRRVENAVAYWNKELKLDQVRAANLKYWLNDPFAESDLYDYQTPYKNNRIFTAEETLVATVMSQKAEPTVTPGGEEDIDYELAQKHEGALRADYDDLALKAKGSLVARHLIIGMRLACLKVRFDPDRGEVDPTTNERKGAIVVEVKDPTKLVLGEDCVDPDVIPMVAEFCEDTIENLVAKYPKKKAEVFAKYGIVRGTNSQISKKIGYVELWFDFRDKNGVWHNAVATKIDKLLLGAMKNPNYKYDEYEQKPDGTFRKLNYFDRPKPPYILFNHLNLGKYVIDSTSLSEQAQPMQDVLNKRGRQITDDADKSDSGTIFNEEMISQETASKLTGDPDEKAMVKGDVRAAAARLPRNTLQNFVLVDKRDAANDVDNIMGANAALRGESTDSKTLGQDVMSQRANMGRVQPLADALESGFDRLYKYLTQMYMVYYDEPVEKSYQGGDERTVFVSISGKVINPKSKVRVKAGSMIPKDKWAIRNETIQTMAILDPLSIAEGLDKPNPKEFAKRLFYYRFAPDKYVSEVLQASETGQDQQAMADIQTIIQTKQMPNVPESPSKDYLATLQNFLQGEGFKTVPADIQQLLIQFAEAVTNKVKGALGEPTEEEPAPAAPGEEEAPAPTPGAGGTPAPVQQQSFLQRMGGAVKSMFGGGQQ